MSGWQAPPVNQWPAPGDFSQSANTAQDTQLLTTQFKGVDIRQLLDAIGLTAQIQALADRLTSLEQAAAAATDE